MKNILTPLFLTGCLIVNAQADKAALKCVNPVNPFAENITAGSALLTWQPYNKAPIAYNIVWRPSGVGATWDSIFNIADTSYLLTKLKTNTYYEFKPAAICTDTISQYRLRWVFSTLAKSGYCAAHSSGLTYIQSVMIGAKKKVSGNNNGYGDFTDITFPLAAGNKYTAYIKALKGPISVSALTVSIYIDFNQNKSLADSGELVARKTMQRDGVFPFQFTIPAYAINGTTRMRVIVEDASLAYNAPCNYTNGEAEDYTVKILNASAQSFDITDNKIAIQPNPANNIAGIKYDILKDGKVELMIFDRGGRTIQTFQQGLQTKGSYNKQINTSCIGNGNYVIAVVQNGTVINRAMMIIQH